MAEEKTPRRLGRGLAALIGEEPIYRIKNPVATDAGEKPAITAARPEIEPVNPEVAELVRGMREVPIEFLKANPYQPRHIFREEDLADLAASIRERGILQPILVRPIAGKKDAYEIVAGERRWRAAQRAQLHQVPIVIRELSDTESLEIAIIENVQRADLNAIEEAMGYDRLMRQFDHTQEQLSRLIGKSRSHVANTLRLLGLPEPVQGFVQEGKLSAGHARALVGHPRAEALAREISTKGLSVREAEALARKQDANASSGKASASGRAASATHKDADTMALERTVSEKLGLIVDITWTQDKGGEIRIIYKTLEQLDEVTGRLTTRGKLVR